MKSLDWLYCLTLFKTSTTDDGDIASCGNTVGRSAYCFDCLLAKKLVTSESSEIERRRSAEDTTDHCDKEQLLPLLYMLSGGWYNRFARYLKPDHHVMHSVKQNRLRTL